MARCALRSEGPLRRRRPRLASVGGAREPPAPRRQVKLPLPLARWGPPRPQLALTAHAHEQLATAAEAILRRLLVTDNYDSVTNFIGLYDAFQKAETPLAEVYAEYAPPIRSKRHTCVGLGLELLRRWRSLEKSFPGFLQASALLSCEEAVADLLGYVAGGSPAPPAEKEHVMVGVQVRLEGRPGLLLADPGYHVPRLVTVMADSAYPHTGWFRQSEEGAVVKEYSYAYSAHSGAYVEWREREARGAARKAQVSLVYAARPYLDGVNVTERRNLVYNFRSLLSRDQKGHVVAGLYFPVGAACRDAQFTLFFDHGGQKRKTKHKFAMFTDQHNIPESVEEELDLCNAQLNYKKGELRNIIVKLAQVMGDQSFIDQMLEINDDICRMSL